MDKYKISIQILSDGSNTDKGQVKAAFYTI